MHDLDAGTLRPSGVNRGHAVDTHYPREHHHRHLLAGEAGVHTEPISTATAQVRLAFEIRCATASVQALNPNYRSCGLHVSPPLKARAD
jgi:hypothetical protein